MNDVHDLLQWLRAQLDWQEGIARRARDADEAADRLFAGHCSPNWTLREVEAKRQRIALALELLEEVGNPYAEATGCRLLKLEALPFAVRPGYRQEWRP